MAHRKPLPTIFEEEALRSRNFNVEKTWKTLEDLNQKLKHYFGLQVYVALPPANLRRACLGFCFDVGAWEILGSWNCWLPLRFVQMRFTRHSWSSNMLWQACSVPALAYGLLRASRGHGNWGRTEPSASRRFNEGRRLGWMKFGQDKRPTK